MRVLIAAGAVGALTPLRAGTALAVAWADLGAQVAVVPVADAGEGFVQAFADAERIEVDVFASGPDAPLALAAVAGDVVAVGLEGNAPGEGIAELASSAPLGDAVAGLVGSARPDTLYVDLAWAATTHDAGAGLLAGLGAQPSAALRSGLAGLRRLDQVDVGSARDLLGATRLVGVIPYDQRGQQLLGLRGISSTRGHAAGVDLAETMSADAALERYCSLIDPGAAQDRDAGACGGAAYAVVALGGRIVSGVEECARRADLERSLAVSDLVVACCDRFDFHTRGGGLVAYLADRAAAAGVPLVVVAGERQVGNREMRSFGVEAAYGLDLADPTLESMIDAARPIARTWTW